MNLAANFERKCRICVADILDMACGINIFGKSGARVDQKMSRYLYITVDPEDELPKYICATCYIKLESIDKFAYLANQTQDCFKSWLKKSKDEKLLEDAQTTIETSTNSDFSFRNITIKKEFNNADQQQKIFFQTFKNPRNPRHVDHITLEQIINDQIIKNPRVPASTTITPIIDPRKPQKRQRRTKSEMRQEISTVSSYSSLQLGQLIKDQELLKLILRALKWSEFDRKASYEELLARLKLANCRDILTNRNLLNDNDVIQLIKSYVGTDSDTVFNSCSQSKVVSLPSTTINQPIIQNDPYKQNIQKNQNAPANIFFKNFQIGDKNSVVQKPLKNPKILRDPPVVSKSVVDLRMVYNGDDSVTSMEVRVDPNLYFADDDEETLTSSETQKEDVVKKESLQESKKTIKKVGFQEVIQQKNITLQDIKDGSSQIINDGQYFCISCPKTFTSTSELQNHVLTHLIKEKPTTRSSNTVQLQTPSVSETLQVSPVPEIQIPVESSKAQVSPQTTKASSSPKLKTNLRSSKIKIIKRKTDGRLRKRKKFAIKIKLSTKKISRKEKLSDSKNLSSLKNKKSLKSLRNCPSGKEARLKETKQEELKDIRSQEVKDATPTTATNSSVCPICNKKLSTRGNLKVHIESHREPKGNYKCDLCFRIFKSLVNLLRHKECHTKNANKFTCTTCKRVYPSLSTLKLHTISHSMERPHACHYCAKTFKRKQDLKFHLNQHTGEFPFSCNFCTKTFTSSGNCHSHRKRMHADKLREIAESIAEK